MSNASPAPQPAPKRSKLLIASLALNLATEAYVLETGNVVMSGRADDVKNDAGIRRSYLGY